jgi:hypothetical protein
MGKDGDRRSDEDHREDDTAVTIDVLSAFRLPIALQNCRLWPELLRFERPFENALGKFASIVRGFARLHPASH